MTKEQIIEIIGNHKGKLLGKLEGINAPEAYLELIRGQFHFLIEEVKKQKERNEEYNGYQKQE